MSVRWILDLLEPTCSKELQPACPAKELQPSVLKKMPKLVPTLAASTLVAGMDRRRLEGQVGLCEQNN